MLYVRALHKRNHVWQCGKRFYQFIHTIRLFCLPPPPVLLFGKSSHFVAL
jgi:hypothetical protein